MNAKTLPWEITNYVSHAGTAPPAFAHRHEDEQQQSHSHTEPADQAPKKAYDLKDAASKAEYEAIMNVLKQVNFNKTKAAEILKIDRKTLYNKIKSFEEMNN